MRASAAPVAATFDRAMEAVGPFEPGPHVAVAVSGGPDSVALALVAASWARRRGGRVTALTVDHALRRGSSAEAGQVARWMAAKAIGHHILTWSGAKPETGIQAAARAARYALLTGWCRDNGVLHLLLAHQRDDQAETFLIRLGRRSGPDGLACMPGVAHAADVRLVRPLLGVPRAALVAYLERRGQGWIEDPSNEDPKFTRVRIRRALEALRGAGVPSEGIVDGVARFGEARAALDETVAGFLARSVDIHPTGHCVVDATALAAAPAEIGRRALARIVTCIGGGGYPPRSERLERLYRELADGGLARRRTLAGCLLWPDGARIIVSREPSAVAPPEPAVPGHDLVWDGRFRIRIAAAAGRAPGGRKGVLGALGEAGLNELTEKGFSVSPWPRAVLLTVPAIRLGGGLAAVPHANYRARAWERSGLVIDRVAFEPANRLATASFSVV